MNKHKYFILIFFCLSYPEFPLNAQDDNPVKVLTLKEAISIALVNNHDIRISRNEVTMSENNAKPGNAGLFPSLDARGNYTEELNNTNIEFATPQQPPINRDNARSSALNASVNFSYNIFSGLGKYYQFQSLKNLNKTGNAQLRLNIENTLLAVHRRYFDLIRSKENLRINKMLLQISAERFRRMQEQYRYGGTGKLNVLNARVDLNTDSINVENALNNLKNARHNLNILLGQEPSTLFAVDTVIPAPKAVSTKQALLDSALNNNVQLQLAQYQLKNAQIQQKIAKAGHYPRLDLRSSYGYNKVDNEAGFTTLQETYGLSGGISLRFNIFNGRQQSIKIQNAEITVDSRKENKLKIMKQIKRDVLNSYNAYTKNLNLLNMAKDDVKTAQLNFRQSKELLETGQITGIEFRNSQLNLMKALLRQTQYKIQVKLSEINLKKTGGVLLKQIKKPYPMDGN